VGREDLLAQQPGSALDVLRRLPGLHVEQPGGRGAVSSLFTRGGDPNFTLVLVDGVPVNDPTNTRGGSFDFATLPVESIERIEVVRGPLSAVYGSDALAGVVNVVTREPSRTPSASVAARGGRFGDHGTTAFAQGPVGRAAVAVGAVYEDDGTPVEGDVFRIAGVNGRLDAPLGPTADLGIATRLAGSHAESFPDDSGGPEFAVLRETDRRDVREATIALTPTIAVTRWLTAALQGTFYDRVEEADSPGVAPGRRDPFGIPRNAADTAFRRTTASVRVLATPAAAVTLLAGVEARFEDGTADGMLDVPPRPLRTRFELARETYAPYAELQISPYAGLRLHAGTRTDFPTGFDAETSPRIGAAYTLARTDTTVRASWGRAFKLPSFFALGHPVVGNPALVPERGESVDAGVRQALGHRATAGVTWFRSRFEHLIDLDEGPPARLVNRDEATAEGLEVELELRPLDGLTVASHATYTALDLHGTAEELRGRPDWQGGLTASWRPRRDLTLAVTAVYVGRVFDSSIPTGDLTLEPYGRVDMAMTWEVVRHWTLTLAVDDLLDADYARAVGFPAPGPWVRVGVRFTT
jgi:vitamin B12 transporter